MRNQPKMRWGESHIYFHKEGATVHSQREYVGYGFTSYNIVGSFDEVSEVVKSIYTNYPTPGYGTVINWPPNQVLSDGSPRNYNQPTEISPGLWWLTCRHSESCE